jgi:hypothetical protein
MTSNNPFDLPTGRAADDVPAPLPGTVEDPLTYSPETTSDTYDATSGTYDTFDTSGTSGAGGAKEQASHLASEASQAGGHVAHVAGEQTKKVASEAGTQAKNLLHTVGDEVRSQASTQQSRVAQSLRSVGDELSQMAQNSDSSGAASKVVNTASDRVQSVAQWLEDREPGDLLDEVKSFARRRPGLFIGIAAGVGILAGRVTRAVTDHGDDSSSSSYGRTGNLSSGALDDTTATAQYVPVVPVDDIVTPVDDTIVPPVYPGEPGLGTTRTDGGL